MTLKVTLTIEEGQEFAARVRTFNTAANGERYHDNCDVIVQPGGSTEVYLHGSRMLEVTEASEHGQGADPRGSRGRGSAGE